MLDPTGYFGHVHQPVRWLVFVGVVGQKIIAAFAYMLTVPKPVGGSDEADSDKENVDHPAKGLGSREDPLKQIGDTVPNCVHN